MPLEQNGELDHVLVDQWYQGTTPRFSLVKTLVEQDTNTTLIQTSDHQVSGIVRR